jgi:pyruvate dehydrogenase E2 component (dihydrolipoamide acetyltransferase)
MPVTITIPRLGWSMEEGTFGNWLKRDGDHVKPGEALFTVESDKVTMDVESLDSGVLYLPPDAPEPAKASRLKRSAAGPGWRGSSPSRPRR